VVTNVLTRDSVKSKAGTNRSRAKSEPVVEREKVRLSLDVSPELNDLLDTLAYKTHSSKSDVLRKAIALMEVAVLAKEQGQTIGVAEKGGMTLLKEIIGL
jgi:predicted transcriptional regulator